MKTAIITGASGNLGQAITQKFLEENIRVVGTISPRNESPFETSERFVPVTIDLSNEDATGKMVQRVIREYGAIDFAVLTVGGFAMNSIAETPLSEIQKQFTLNFETTYILARLVFIQMQAQGHGRIFLTGARTGSDMKFSRGFTAYGLSKSLIFRLAELMNEEAKGSNVVTTVIAPSIIDTPVNRSAMPDTDFSKWVQPRHIADAVYTYCTPDLQIVREPILKLYNKA